jgi:hypothetical protein
VSGAEGEMGRPEKGEKIKDQDQYSEMSSTERKETGICCTVCRRR